MDDKAKPKIGAFALTQDAATTPVPKRIEDLAFKVVMNMTGPRRKAK